MSAHEQGGLGTSLTTISTRTKIHALIRLQRQEFGPCFLLLADIEHLSLIHLRCVHVLPNFRVANLQNIVRWRSRWLGMIWHPCRPYLSRQSSLKLGVLVNRSKALSFKSCASRSGTNSFDNQILPNSATAPTITITPSSILMLEAGVLKIGEFHYDECFNVRWNPGLLAGASAFNGTKRHATRRMINLYPKRSPTEGRF
jgi:hypothetical protein